MSILTIESTPSVVIKTKPALRKTLLDPKFETRLGSSRWSARAEPIVALIKELQAKRERCDNVAVMRKVEQELGIPRQADNVSVLALLVYTAQRWVEVDSEREKRARLEAEGFVPCTEDFLKGCLLRKVRLMDAKGTRFTPKEHEGKYYPMVLGGRSKYAVLWGHMVKECK